MTSRDVTTIKPPGCTCPNRDTMLGNCPVHGSAMRFGNVPQPPKTVLGVVGELLCPKCGGEKITVRWHSGGRHGVGGCGLFAKVTEPGEHMHHTCATCLYEWTGVPADA